MKTFGVLLVVMLIVGVLSPSGTGIGVFHLAAQQGPGQNPEPGNRPGEPNQPQPLPNPPVINSQSTGQTVAPESDIVLSVTATGEGLSYQWFFNGAAIRNAKNSSLTIRRVRPQHVGTYFVIVSNRGGFARSGNMNVNIEPPRTTGIGIDWTAAFDPRAPGFHRPNDVETDSGGNSYVVGEAPNREGNSDFLVAKYDPDGNEVWSRLIDPSQGQDDAAARVAVHPNGDVIVVGTSSVNGQGVPPQIFATAITPDGERRWAETISDETIRGADAVDLALAPGGDIVIVATAQGPRNRDIATFRLTAGGRQLWSQRYDNQGRDSAASVAVSRNGTVLVVGTSASSDRGDDIVAILYDRNGNESFTQRFEGEQDSNDVGVTALFDSQNRPIVVGALGTRQTGLDFFVAGLRPNGRELYRTRVPGRGRTDDIPVGAVVDGTNSVIIAGNSTVNNPGSEGRVVKITPQGQRQWVQTVPSNTRPGVRINGVVGTNDGGIIVTGAIANRTTGVDAFNIKYNGDSSTEWHIQPRFHESGRAFDAATAVDVDPRGDVIMVGLANEDVNSSANQPAARTLMLILKQQITPPAPNRLPIVRILDPSGDVPLVFGQEIEITVTATDADGPIQRLEILVGDDVIASSTNELLKVNWEVDRVGPLIITARATDGSGAIATAAQPFETNVPDISPVIVGFPGDQTVTPGSTVRLEATVTGIEPMRFQWLLNGQRLKVRDGSGVQGINSPTLIIENFGAANAGRYELLVENRAGRAKSPTANIELDIPRIVPRDNFADRQALAGESGQVSFSNEGATREPGEPRHAGKRSNQSVWFSYVAPAPGIATIETIGANFDTLLAVYQGDALGNLSSITSDEDGGGFLTSSVRFRVEADQEYIIVVDGFNRNQGTAILTWNLDRTRTINVPRFTVQPAETVARRGSDVTLRATLTGPRPDGVTLQWFFNDEAIPGATQPQLTINNVRPPDTGKYWVEATLGTLRATSDRASIALAARRAVNAVSVPEVKVESKFADLFFFIAPNAQGLQARRRPIPLAASLATGFSGAQIFNTFGAVKELGEPDHCGIPGGASQWFAYQPPINGTVGMTTDGSDFDTVLAVYVADSADFTSLTEVACDNDSGIDGMDSTVSFDVTADTIYYIAVDGVEAATGVVEIAYAMDLPLELEVTASSGLSFGDIQITEFTYTVTAAPNVDFVIESSSDLVTWTTVTTAQAEADGTYQFTDQQFSLDTFERYFRVFYP